MVQNKVVAALLAIFLICAGARAQPSVFPTPPMELSPTGILSLGAPFNVAGAAGIDNTGNTDISTAISALMARYQYLFFPCGTYLFAATEANSSFRLEAAGRCTKVKSPSASPALTIAPGTNFGQIENFLFEGAPGNTRAILNNGQNVKLINNAFASWPGYPIACVGSSGSPLSGNDISGGYILDSGGGISYTWCPDFQIDNHVDIGSNSGHGVLLLNSSNGIINDNDINTNAGIGIYCQTSGQLNVHHNLIDQNLQQGSVFDGCFNINHDHNQYFENGGPTSALGAAITTTLATTATLTKVGTIPANPSCAILIDTEQMLVGSGCGTTSLSSITRGYNGTVAATHLISAPVTLLNQAALGAAIVSTSATTATLATTGSFPVGASCIIQIDSELMYVGAGCGTTSLSTITRGFQGTTAATHLINALATILYEDAKFTASRDVLSTGNKYFDWTGSAHTAIGLNSDGTNTSPIRVETEQFDANHLFHSAFIGPRITRYSGNQTPSGDLTATDCSHATSAFTGNTYPTAYSGLDAAVWLGGISSVVAEDQVLWDGPGPIVVCGFTVRLTTAPGLGETYSFVVRHNKVDTGLTGTVSGASTFIVSTVGTPFTSFFVAPGESLDIQLTPSGGAASGSFLYTLSYALK